MHEKTTQELAITLSKEVKVSGDKMAKAMVIFNKNLSKANSSFARLGQALESARPAKEVIKKKRGARYTKRRICKRTGKSSSH